jgi:hypothetical protein
MVIKRVQLRQFSEESSFETPACRNMSSGTEKLISVVSCRIMARKELGCGKETSCVI